MTAKDYLGENNHLGLQIWSKKYAKGEDFDTWIERVSGGDAALKKLISDQKFLFGGRTLANRGVHNSKSLSNCYSSGYMKDHISDIMDLCKKLALTYKAGGGQGVSLSNIRPYGASTGVGMETSDGIVPFMELLNQVTDTISQGGARKGALLLSLAADHPEILRFINLKRQSGKVEKANLSVEISDEFMSVAVQGGVVSAVKVYGAEKFPFEYSYDPAQILREIAASAWDNAEPGVIFTDRFRNYNFMEHYDNYKIVTGNPCVTGDTLILTQNGYEQIQFIAGSPTTIWNGYKWSDVIPKVTGHSQPLMRITFSNGAQLKCTPYHKFILKTGARVEAKDLKPGYMLMKHEFPVIQGDYTPQTLDLKTVPDGSYTIESRLAWLGKLLDQGIAAQIYHDSNDLEYIDQIRYLLNTLGIDGPITTFAESGRTKYRISIGRYYVSKLKELGIQSVRVEMSGATTTTVRQAARFVRIESIETLEEIAPVVYCVEEPDNHSVIFNGILTANCGEQPLPEDGACGLGSLNLYKFVEKPFTTEAYFDIESFKEAISIAVKALDDVLEEGLSRHPVPEQKSMATRFRNIGLGIMGLGDALYALGITYGSNKALEWCDNVFRTMINSAAASSVLLAVGRGAFPECIPEKIVESEFAKRNLDEDVIEFINEYGLRNASLLSIAPAGSIGTMLGVSTGIEPVYAHSYTRTTETLMGASKSFEVDSQVISDYRKVHPDGPLPPHFVTAYEISPLSRIQMQATIQKYIDTGISSTVNLPYHASKEEIEMYLKQAWELGIKGITFYRDGCNRSQILTTNQLKDRALSLVTGCGVIDIAVQTSGGKPTGVSLVAVKGGCSKNIGTVIDLLNLLLKTSGDIQSVQNAIEKNSGCKSCTMSPKDLKGTSCSDIILKGILGEITSGDENILICPECGEKITVTGSCYSCSHCGYSKCD